MLPRSRPSLLSAMRGAHCGASTASCLTSEQAPLLMPWVGRGREEVQGRVSPRAGGKVYLGDWAAGLEKVAG